MKVDWRKALAHDRAQRLHQPARVHPRAHPIRSGNGDIKRDTTSGRHDGQPQRSAQLRDTRSYFLSCVITTTRDASAVNTDAIVLAWVNRSFPSLPSRC